MSHSVIAGASEPGPNLTRRTALFAALIALLAALVAALTLAFPGRQAEASEIDPKQTVVVLPKDIKSTAWRGFPAHTRGSPWP